MSLRLAAHMQRTPPVAVTLPWREPTGKPTTVSLLFTSRESKAINENYLNARLWKPALVTADVIPTRVSGRGMWRAASTGTTR